MACNHVVHNYPGKILMLALVSGFEIHCLWFFVNRANALAPIAFAFIGALSTPPDALT